MDLSLTFARPPQFTLHIDTQLQQAFCGVTGPSGAGKSSLLRALAGLEAGATLHRPVTEHGPVGLVFQDNLLFPHLTVAQNLALARRYAGPAWLETDAITAGCHCAHLIDRHPTELSGGEAQRVALARALMNQPRLLLLDEPLSAVDGPTRQQILHYLAGLADTGLKILMVSHDVSDLLHCCQQVLLLENGQLTHQGSAQQVLDHYFTHSVDAAGETVSVLSGPTTDGAPAGYKAFTVGKQRVLTRQGSESDSGRLSVPAAAVILHSQPGLPTSLENALDATVMAIAPMPYADGNHHLVTLNVGGQTLYAEISSQALHNLQLHPGQAVVACFAAAF